MESDLWLVAASRVLGVAGKPMHISQLRQLILNQNLVPAGITSTLEGTLSNEMQNVTSQFKSIPSHPGFITLMPTDQSQQHPSEAAPAKAESLHKTLNVNGSAVATNRFEKKHKHLKKLVKQMIFVNASVCDEVVRMEDKVTQAKEERRFLLKQVLQQQAMSTMLGQMVSGKQPTATTLASPVKGSGGSGGGGTRLASQSVAQLLGEAEKRSKKKAAATTAAGGSTSGKKKAAGGSREVHNSPDDSLKLKLAKKVKMSCKRLVQSIPLDDTGRPILPIELGNLVVYCLGEIVSDRPGFHTAEYIYPVGFCTTRVYAGVHENHTKCLYTCKIQDGGPSPQFEISPEDTRGQSFTGTTASECHQKLLDAVLKTRSLELSTLENKGPEFFGFSHPTIQNLIQSCPGARKCNSYEWQKFEATKDSTEKHTPATEDDPLVNFDALQKFISSQQGVTQQKEVETPSSSLQPSASLRSLLTSAPLVQAPPTSGC